MPTRRAGGKYGLIEDCARTDMDLEERPTTILAEEPLAPRGPWAFLKAAFPGGFTPWGWGLMGGWVLVR